MKAWGGRFSEAPDALAAEFGRSIDVDRELALDDLAGSVAHVRGLGRAGLLTADEVEELIRGLARAGGGGPRGCGSPGTPSSRTCT